MSLCFDNSIVFGNRLQWCGKRIPWKFAEIMKLFCNKTSEIQIQQLSIKEVVQHGVNSIRELSCVPVFSSGNVNGLIVPTVMTEGQFASEQPDSKETIMPVLDLSVLT